MVTNQQLSLNTRVHTVKNLLVTTSKHNLAEKCIRATASQYTMTANQLWCVSEIEAISVIIGV
jgi:hypothetical protein